jgi:hypothetical protein
LSPANRGSDGPDGYARLIVSTAVSFITTLFLYTAQALAGVGCVLNYRFWLINASKLPLRPLLKSHTNHGTPVCQVNPAPTPAQTVKQDASHRFTRQKNALFTPVHRQQAVLGVQRA